ncbi:MAG: UDP-N-acetylglucosamine 1-carboxyvinyltransferase, partial [Candidatus Theseobacter exili]|nr:UDP-N-acetylglucosamine 1-carboxyvinyltransferase [Candidatus Theseobacter exili]
MDKMVLEGNVPLKGEVCLSGAKNAALPILAATILCKGETIIHNVPNLRDIRTMISILQALGLEVERDNSTVRVNATGIKHEIAPYDLVKTMRASICVLGPLLGRLGKAKVSMPGGCVIGPRPIDLHLKGLLQMGVNIKVEHGYIHANAQDLHGAEVFLG